MMFAFQFGVVLVVTIAGIGNSQGQQDPPLHCLNCMNVPAGSELCPHLVECSGECYVRSNTIDGKTITSYGCEKRQTCNVTDGNLIGRRRSVSVNTTSYCKKELCNKDIHHFLDPPTTPCTDLSVDDCSDPAAREAICSSCEMAQYCRKSCGLCQEYTGGDTWSENLVLFDYNPVPTQCNYSQAIGPSICNSIKARGLVVPHGSYLNLHQVNSYVQINFTTHGEPLTNLQLFSCQTTGHGRVDVVLNNVTIAESYNKTHVWSWDWNLHELNPVQHKHTHNYVLEIFKDRKTVSYGHFWLRRIRLETTVVHHRHGK
uniref:Uncharacterized protein LOC111130664 n=1 Tax=Crassostrea virginica TaxID=6565 RepID=A0A8B8DZ92_CRAVI|nr:uncharacterized protein LOC111130664 [Crassostrea virginica]